MDGDPIIDDSSIDGTSEYWPGPKSEPSSPDNRSTRFGHSTPSCTPLRDMWLGQKYLENVIALQLHSLAHAEDIVPELQSQLKVNLQDFPFSQCCAYLHANGGSGQLDPSSRATNYRHTLLSWIGHVAHAGSMSEDTLVRNAISLFVDIKPLNPASQWNENQRAQNERPPANNARPRAVNGGGPATRIGSPSRNNAGARRMNGGGPSTGVESPPRNDAETLEPTGRPATQNGNTSRKNGGPIAQNGFYPIPNGSPPAQHDLAQYTSLLKEYCDNAEETPSWVESNIGTLDRPCFSCRVTFRGVTSEGTGRQKRYAKHEACFKACQILGIQPK